MSRLTGAMVVVGLMSAVLEKRKKLVNRIGLKSRFIAGRCFVMGGLLLGLLANTSWAGILGNPIATSNRSPFIQIFGLPPAYNVRSVGESEWTLGSHLEWSSIAVVDESSGQRLTVDGETVRLSFDVRYGLTDKWELGMRLPLIHHGAGLLDGVITDWHDLFNLPDGMRNDLPVDDINFSFRHRNSTPFALNSSASGFGDMLLDARYLLEDNEEYAVSVGAGVKLPFGSGNKLTGSGGTDVYFSGNFYQTFYKKQNYHWELNTSGGVLQTSEGDVLPEYRKKTVLFGSSALAWIYDYLSLKVQLDYHTPFYEGPFEHLNSGSIQLVFGGSLRISENSILDLTIAEDIYVAQSPDVVFQVSYRIYDF